MKLNENIKKYRKINGLTQSELAKKLNVTTRTIQNYESGNREPSFDMLMRIAVNLNVNVESLVDYEEYKKLIKKREENEIVFNSLDYYREDIKQYWEDVVVWYPLDYKFNFNLGILSDDEIEEIATNLSFAFDLKIKEIIKRHNSKDNDK